MKRLLSVLLLCHITISFLWAQPVHQVKGTVIDKSSRQPLEFINVQSPNQKIPDRKTKCVIKTHINIKQNVIFGAKLKPV